MFCNFEGWNTAVLFNGTLNNFLSSLECMWIHCRFLIKSMVLTSILRAHNKHLSKSVDVDKCLVLFSAPQFVNLQSVSDYFDIVQAITRIVIAERYGWLKAMGYKMALLTIFSTFCIIKVIKGLLIILYKIFLFHIL